MRDTMAALILLLRDMADDNIQAQQEFSDLTLQNALDRVGFAITESTAYLYPGATETRADTTVYAYDLHRAAAELWLQKAGRTARWKGNFQQYAQMQINFHLAQSWPDCSATNRT